LRQVLSAPLRRRSKAVPARLRPGAVSLFPTRRHGDAAILEKCALTIAYDIQRSDDVGRELAGFHEHCFDHVFGKLAEQPFIQCGRKPRTVLERKRDLGNRRLVSHALWPMKAELRISA